VIACPALQPGSKDKWAEEIGAILSMKGSATCNVACRGKDKGVAKQGKYYKGSFWKFRTMGLSRLEIADYRLFDWSAAV
jgi:hypothetical protein